MYLSQQMKRCGRETFIFVSKVTINYLFFRNLIIIGADKGEWYLDLKNGSGSCGEGAAPNGADCEMSLDSEDFAKMFKGELKAVSAFMGGKLKIKGDMGLAMKLEKLMNQMNSKL